MTESLRLPSQRTIALRRIPLLEIFFCGFLFAGVFKADQRFAGFPIDITLFFAIGMLALATPVLLNSRFLRDAVVSKFLIVAFLFHAWAAASVSWGSSTAQSMSTVGQIFINHLPAILGGLAIASSSERVRKLFLIVVLVSVWVAVETAYALATQGLGPAFIRILSGQYQLTTSTLGVGSIAALALSHFAETRLARFGFIFVAIALVSLTPTIGGRAAILAATGTAVVALLSGGSWRSGQSNIKSLLRRLIFVVVGGVLFLIALSALTAELPVGLRRLADFVSNPVAGSGGRATLWLQGIQTWLDNPLFGTGLGAFALENGYGDVQGYYPHNMPIQIAAETGIIGLCLFLVMIWIPLRELSLRSSRPARCAQFLVLCALLFYSIQMMAVGSIVNKQFYAMLTLLLCARAATQTETQGIAA